jgi:hypothetical protein
VAESEWDAMGDSSHFISEFTNPGGGLPVAEHPGLRTSVEDDQAEPGDDLATKENISSMYTTSRTADRVTTPSPPPTTFSPSSPGPSNRDSSLNGSMVPADRMTEAATKGSIMDALNTPLQTIQGNTNLSSMSTDSAETPTKGTVDNTLQYRNMDWQFLAPHWLWNKNARCMWRLTVNLTSCSSSITDTRKALLFLALRGQPFRSPRPVFKNLEHIMHEAKGIMLDRIFSSLMQRTSISSLEGLFKLVITPYSNELKRLSLPTAQETSYPFVSTSSGTVGQDTTSRFTSHAGIDSSKSPVGANNNQTIRQTWVGSIFSGGLSGNLSHFQSASKSLSDNSSYMDSEPIEPAHAMYLFLPNINSVGGKIRVHRRQSSESSGMHEDNVVVKVPLSGRRDSFGTLIISQTEMLSYIWLPIILLKPDIVDIDYVRWSLCTYITALRGSSPPVPVHPAVSILLLNLLVLERRYAEMAHLVQLQFFPDSIEVAMAVLELSDIISQSVDDQGEGTGKETMVGYDRLYQDVNLYKFSTAIQVLQQVGLDMLWRMQEKTTVVRWLLGRGRVLESITLCTKVRGQYRQGLSPGSISGIDFYIAALEAANMIVSEMFADVSDEDVLDEEESPIKGCTNIDSADNEAGWGDWDKDATEWFNNRDYEDMLKSRRAELLHTVYKFIKDWDHSVLLKTPAVRQLNKLPNLVNIIIVSAVDWREISAVNACAFSRTSIQCATSSTVQGITGVCLISKGWYSMYLSFWS